MKIGRVYVQLKVMPDAGSLFPFYWNVILSYQTNTEYKVALKAKVAQNRLKKLRIVVPGSLSLQKWWRYRISTLATILKSEGIQAVMILKTLSRRMSSPS